MKYKWYKNPIKYKQELKEIEEKAKKYSDLIQYLYSCILIEPLYEEIKNKNGVILGKYLYDCKFECNLNIDELYRMIGIELNPKE